MSGMKNAEDKIHFNLKVFINVKTIKFSKRWDRNNRGVYYFQMVYVIL